MAQRASYTASEIEEIENREWVDSLDWVLGESGPDRVRELLGRLQIHARASGVDIPFTASTPHINTIPAADEVPYPGGREIERRIKSLVRWNAMAMVVRANRETTGIGGHISTFASAATLYQVAFHHFLRGRTEHHPGDIVYFQGHASPGIYGQAFLEGRLSEQDLEGFRKELRPGGGLSSYPHPWLMPGFWQFPTVSMGLSPIMAIYQARFNRYMEDRGLLPRQDVNVWAFLGDGETDEPETLGAVTLAARERLDNLIFVINCNLQRLDGPVRGNGKIIQELEAAFRGAGWNVIKTIWGSNWDPLIAADRDGLLVKRMSEVVDGESQRYSISSGSFIRESFFGKYRKLRAMVDHLSDEQLARLRLGGHDPQKVYNAYKAAVEHRGSPTVILARTIKGYGLGEAGEGRNITHQQKKLNEEELRHFRTRFGIPISDDEVADAPFYRPPEDSAEIRYLTERRRHLGGSLPKRLVQVPALPLPPATLLEELKAGSGGREVSTTMAFVRILTKLLDAGEIGKRIVPIIPDEARTFGMESLFRKIGIYAHMGQLYEPVDADTLLYYHEARDGQLLEEGITEAGSMSSFIAAGTSYATHGEPMIPFFIFYSMFGLQRVGDLVWAGADARCRGFMIGGTAGRTTLAGEGLQHQDGSSHLLALPIPTLKAYDPAFAFELAVIIQDGLRRMYELGEDLFYYITVENEPYAMPEMPEGVEEGILRGLYRFRKAGIEAEARVDLLGSGAILNEVVRAQEILGERYGVAADVWSITSFKELYLDGIEADRANRLHPGETRQVPYLSSALEGTSGTYVIASDYVKALAHAVCRWFPSQPTVLGTDGFGRSDSREALRRFFEVDAEHVVVAALSSLAADGKIDRSIPLEAIEDLGVEAGAPNPILA